MVEPGATPSVAAPVTLAQDDDVEVTWADAPARKWDWVGIYPVGEMDLYNGYLAFAYTDATVSGSYTFTADDLGDEMLAPGDYVAVLMSDDGYAVLDQQPFTVG
ncbi:MAG: hypothetical protein JWN99_381 [Ilumatobacteraceae bacterium]|nr:hypothetical protein [Ilumatobacteraceae bacterium]